MTRKFTHVTALLVAMTLSIPAKAAGWLTTQIAQIEYDSSGSLNLYTYNNNECGSTRAVYVTSNDDIGRAILAMLLAWQAQGMGINIYISACNGTIGTFTAVYNQ